MFENDLSADERHNRPNVATENNTYDVMSGNNTRNVVADNNRLGNPDGSHVHDVNDDASIDNDIVENTVEHIL